MKRMLLAALAVLLSLGPSGCGKKEPVDPSRLKQVYFINNEQTGVEMHECEVQSRDAEGQLAELVALLGTIPDKLEYKAPFQMGFEVRSFSVEGEKVCVDVGEGYRSLSATTEILVRAAIVRTLSQLPGVKYVSITVEGGQLYDSLGSPVGLMSADQFIDNAGNEINAYERVTLKLYFANQDGTGLIAVNRTIAYNTNIPLEKLVVEQVLAGPGEDIADVVCPTVNAGAKVISIVVRDGICYVNFDEAFLSQPYNVTAETAIYSVVDSLTELTGVNKVQISVGGKTDLLYQESISLNTMFERNLDLLTTVE